MFPKPHRLPPYDIVRVMKTGKKSAAEGLFLFNAASAANNPFRIAVVVPFKIERLATRRNRAKRVMREAVRGLLPVTCHGQDAVLVMRKSITGITVEILRPVVRGLFVRAGLLCEKS